MPTDGANPYEPLHANGNQQDTGSHRPQPNSGRERRVAFNLTAIVIAVGTIMLCIPSPNFFGGVFVVPFALGPLFLSLALAKRWRDRVSQIAISAGTLAYAVWFVYVYLTNFLSADPQAGIPLLFIGIWAMPVMACVWGIAAACHYWPYVTAGK